VTIVPEAKRSGTDGSSLSPNPTLLRRDLDVASRVVQYIQEGSYCALLGPRYSGKTGVVRAVEELLMQQLGWPCIYLDLYELEASTQRGFFAALASLIAKQIAERTRREVAALDPTGASSAAFRGFLTDAVLELGYDLVLILDHLEAVPNDLVQALLTSLRAAYMEQQTLDHRLMVVASGALSLATVTVGASSPFRGIAQRVFVGGLSESESQAFIGEQIEADWIQISDEAWHHLFNAARGDPTLLERLYRDAVQLARHTGAQTLEAETVEQITARFLDDEVFSYAPLQEAVRAIEQDPDLLRCVLLLLEDKTVPMAQLPLPLSPDLDPLRLTGVVEKVGGDRYRLRNDVYRRFLARHFDPGRVGYLLTTSGRWDSAIDYLEASIAAGSEQYRWNLLTAIINSMYASDDVGRAAHFLLRGLSAAFGIIEAEVWFSPAHEPSLRLVAPTGTQSGLEIPITADCLEARAYREAASLRGPESGQCVERALPLLTPGRRPIGVVVVQDCLGGNRFVEQRERELRLTGYLNQAARALEQVGKRTQELALAGRVQASLLPRAPRLPGWELAAVLRPARQTAGDFFDFIPLPTGRLGIVVADVVDKGMGAALYMALSRTLIRTYAVDYPDQPELVLHAASARMLSDAGAGLFVTVFYGILDPTRGQLVYCNAGHHPPYLVSAPVPPVPSVAEGSVAEGTTEGRAEGETGSAEVAEGGIALHPLGRTGMALGVIDEATWQQETVQINPGDLLLLYTDGVVEAENREQELFGRERMLEVARRQAGSSAQDTQEALMAALQEFAGNEAQSDDITLVVVKRQPEGLEREKAEPGRLFVEPYHGRRHRTAIV
jgi:serine phosphatase RsbU (regulator of sigma subunit)